jgi:SAM-dependent methyltransferase
MVTQLEKDYLPSGSNFQLINNLLVKVGDFLMHTLGSVRDDEHNKLFRFFDGCINVLDVGCGTGTFMARAPERISGIDINPDNIEICKEKGFNAQIGDALSIPFNDNSYDGAYCSHLMQVFFPNQAAQLIKELGRVVKPGGKIVIVTLNWFERFFRHPENVRAYPPDAIRRYFAKGRGAQSPMFPGIPAMRQKGIWLRRPPLFEFYSVKYHTMARIYGVLNRLQYVIGLRKYWRFDAYGIMLINMK